MQWVKRFPIIDCLGNEHCFNGGTCLKGGCYCPIGYIGQNCENTGQNKFD